MPRAPRRSVPAFGLYGDAPPARDVDLLHIEAIQSRSALHAWEIRAHTHPALHQLIWVARGRASIEFDGAVQAVQGPAAIVIPPGVVHAFRSNARTDGHVVTLDPRGAVEGDGHTAGPALGALFGAARVLAFEPGSAEAQRVSTLLADLHEEAHLGPAAEPVLRWLARAALWRLARATVGPQATRPHAPRALFTRFVVLLEAHHVEHWPVTRYAAALGLSPERLNRLTRAETGRTAQALIHARLVKEACRRLGYLDVPVTTLALELGFDDPAYFCRFFRRATGHSPGAWRAAQDVGKVPSIDGKRPMHDDAGDARIIPSNGSALPTPGRTRSRRRHQETTA